MSLVPCQHPSFHRQEYARHSKASEEATREKLKSARALIEEEQGNKKDISFDLTRQYKTLQVHTETKIQELQVKQLLVDSPQN